MRKKLATAALLSTSFFFLTGSFAVKSKVETQSTVKEGAVEFEFKVVPLNAKEVMISKEGNWRLQLVNTEGLKLKTENGKFETKSFDEALPGFKVKADLDGAAPSGKVDYILNAFVCNTDKSQCFPQIHKGSLEWKKS
jgi:hypothetical protein